MFPYIFAYANSSSTYKLKLITKFKSWLLRILVQFLTTTLNEIRVDILLRISIF